MAICNKNYDLYFINCRFELEFDNSFEVNEETIYIYNIDSENINLIFLYAIKSYESMGYIFCNINQMTTDILIDKCNITYENYISNPMPMVENTDKFCYC